MKGYVKNKTAVWRHAMKRTIGPGHEVALDDLFVQYGEKHGLEEGKSFVDWLRSVKLRDTSIWEISFTDEAVPVEVPQVVEEVKKIVKSKPKRNQALAQDVSSSNMVVPFVKKEIKPEDIINMTVRESREDLKKITDLDLLKYAYNSARQLAGKDTLCNALRKRIRELEITRR